MICIKNAKVVQEHGIIWDGIILVENGRIAHIGKAGKTSIPENAQIVDAQGAYVGPGFVDIHVHGGNGHMFADNPEEAAKHFLSHGETTILPTLYYNLPKNEFLNAIDRIKAAMSTDTAAKAIGGFYMEGPYMNPKYGGNADNNHWKGKIKTEDFCALVDRAGELAKVWAVAPEREGIEPFMAYAKKVNPEVVFSVGHSEATPQQIRRLKKYGIGLQTHCMDATGIVTQWRGIRGCGPDEACLLDSEMYAEMICDSLGVHVNPDLQRIILNIKGIDKVILISDSFVSDEVPPEDFRDVTDLVFDSTGGIAGSSLTMDKACQNIMHHTNCGIAQAFIMASRNPARVIGMDDEIGTVEEGKKANLVFVDDMFNVQRVMLEGIFIDK